MGKKIKTFQEEFHKYFLFCLCVGAYPPGSDDYLKSKFSRWFFYGIGYFFTIGGYINISGVIWNIIADPPPDFIRFIYLVRKVLITMYLISRVAFHLHRHKKVDAIFKRWNKNINTTYMAEDRLINLRRKISKTTRIASIGMFIKGFMAVSYNIPMLMDREFPGGELEGIPHDVNSPYHFYYVASNLVFYTWMSLAVPAADFYMLWLLTIAQNEMDLLQDKLAQILGTLDINEDDELIYTKAQGKSAIIFGGREYKEATNLVDKELLQWTKSQIETLGWIDDMTTYLRLDTTAKYIYLAIHLSLGIIGLIELSGLEAMNDLLGLVLISIGTLWVVFYSTIKVENLALKGNEIFLEGYAKGWYIYPVKTQRFVHLISTGAVITDLNCPALKIYKDNRETTSSVVNMAYQALTFILPMASKAKAE